MGELDVYEDKLCVELHNFEFISNINPYTNSSSASTNSSPYISAPPSTSEKRSLLYNSLNGITNTNSQTKKLKMRVKKRTKRQLHLMLLTLITRLLKPTTKQIILKPTVLSTTQKATQLHSSKKKI